jgi:hypothetical protein
VAKAESEDAAAEDLARMRRQHAEEMRELEERIAQAEAAVRAEASEAAAAELARLRRQHAEEVRRTVPVAGC